MNQIYVLKEKHLNGFDEGEWKLISWTDNPRTAGLWRNSSSMYDRRDFDRVDKKLEEQ